MISNPCTWFAGGVSFENQKSFTYQTSPGSIYLWHFSPYDNQLSNTMENNIVWFASDEKEALKILREIFEFRLQCAYAQSKYYQKENARHSEEFDYRTKGAIEYYLGYLKALDNDAIKISKAPTNQFYTVGWASNDVLR